MAAKKNIINGKVVESRTGKSLSNHRIEAWSERHEAKTPIGTAVSNSEGEFQLAIDPKIFRKLAKDPSPDLYLKVYVGKRFLMSTGKSLLWDGKERKDIDVEVKAPEVSAQDKDRIDTSQILKAASFLNESDFIGVYSDFRQRAGTSLGLFSDMVMNSITELDIEPVRVKGPKMKDIVNNDVELVQTNLKNHDIIVEEVKPYNPRRDADSFRDISPFSSPLIPGQRVHLFEENGKVRYFSVIREDTKLRADGTKLNNKERENLEKIRQELHQSKKVAAEKDQEIMMLQEEIKAIKKDQSEIKNILNSDAFRQFLKKTPSEGPKKEPPRRGKKKPPE